MAHRHLMMLVRAAGLATALSNTARADDPPAPDSKPAVQPAAQPAKGDDADALRGPSLTRRPDRPEHSIVERDFQGRVKKLDDNPALVALGKLEFTAAEKQKVDKAVGDRAAAIDAIVRDNLRLIVEFVQAKQGSATEDSNKLQAQVMEKASPFLRRGPLINELRPALPGDKFAELKGMVDEYNRTVAADRMDDPMSGPKKDNKLGAMLAQGIEGFAAEVRASFHRVVDGGGKEFEDLIKMLQLTPEQESKVRQLAGDFFQKTYGKPTKAQQIQFFLGLYNELDAAQRHRLAEHIGEENRVKRGAGKKE